MLYITAVVKLSKIKYFSTRSCLGVYDFHIIYVFIFLYFYDIFMIFLLSLLPFERFIGHGEHITHDISVNNFFNKSINSFCYSKTIVGKGGHSHPFTRSTHPFSKIPPFLEIQDVPTFHRSIGKTKVLNNSCNQFLYSICPQSILILKECLQKW